jgi:CRISPR/Cas system CSM-associated protein Csm2 small subunit
VLDRLRQIVEMIQEIRARIEEQNQGSRNVQTLGKAFEQIQNAREHYRTEGQASDVLNVLEEVIAQMRNSESGPQRALELLMKAEENIRQVIQNLSG